jgi:hypothetical protein
MNVHTLYPESGFLFKNNDCQNLPYFPLFCMRRRERVVSNRVIFDSELFFLALVPTKIIIRVAKT